MIRRLRMREWRAFTDVEVDLDYPVVFFVAPNGVGKTSLYEAARCALFGFPTGRNAGQLVRGGAKRASVSVDLVLSGAEIRVTRTLTPGGRTTFEAELEGQSLDESAFDSLMTSSWTADRALIDRLVFGDSSPGRGNAPLPVRAHLADLLGVTPLLEAVDTLRAKQKSLATTISALREAEEDTAEASADAERKLATAREALDAAQSERTALSDRLESAERAVTVAAAWEQYRSEVTNYNGAVDALMSDIRDQISITSADPSEGLALARGQVERELEATRQAATEAEVAAAQAAGAADLLRSTTDTCPTCLRPLSEAERNHALHTHGEVASSAEQHTTEASQTSALARDRLGVIEEFTRRLDRLQAPAPPELDDPGPSALTTLEELREQDRALAERVGEARANATAAETALNESRARATERNQLHAAAREELLLGTTADMLEDVANRYLGARIEPLKREVEHRWKQVFGTEGLVLTPEGEVRLQRRDVDLGAQDMSGGELAIANVIVRLLVARAATSIPMLWFDEPLEHLDPRRRAGVAQTLVKAVDSGTVQQVVATTYEEGIARRLARTAPDLVAVVHADLGTSAG